MYRHPKVNLCFWSIESTRWDPDRGFCFLPSKQSLVSSSISALTLSDSSLRLRGYMEDLDCLEKEKKIRPSPEIDAFIKASSVGGRKHSVKTDYVLKVLGLDVCSDTIVSNDMLRGVSEIAEAFKNSKYGMPLKSTLSVPYDKSKNHPAALSKTKLCEGGKILDRILARVGKCTEDEAKAVLIQM
ncbi:hypothetical protein Vadar_012507 [Vaccinium darrowii]|uniref:Uncharacterized protein n=1 Tax=Vaccinium darrowii TaxID=229202 RepID=A0ACB7X984_9ERIC|nr:hypothetical protein Vadar_012507 [Vaccinium darrowii]